MKAIFNIIKFLLVVFLFIMFTLSTWYGAKVTIGEPSDWGYVQFEIYPLQRFIN